MPGLNALQVFTQGPWTYSNRITGLEIATAPGGDTVLYAGSGWGGGIAAWTVAGAGGLTLLDHAGYPQGVDPFAAMAMTMVDVAGRAQLLSVTTGNDTIRLQPLRDNGSFQGQTATAPISGEAPDRPGAVAAANGGVFVAQDGGGIAAYQIGAGGLAFRGETGGGAIVTGLATAEIAGRTYVIAATGTDSAVTSYRVGATGALGRADSIGAADGLGMGRPGPVETVTLGGRTYVLVGASLSSSISVLELGADGSLTARDHVLDTLDSRFGQIATLEIVVRGGTVFVLAGGPDDGLSLLTLLPGGRLIHLHSLADSAEATLDNVTGIAAAALGNGLAVYAASETEQGITRLEVDLSGFGGVISGTGGGEALRGTGRDDIFWGKGGNDTLTGGAGADTFVFDRMNTTQRITDFNPNADRLDLSMLPMFYGAAQLGATGSANGITLTFNTFTLHLNRAGGGTIALSEIAFDTAISHLPTGNTAPLPQPPVPAASLIGTRYADVLRGGAGRDLMRGNAGEDTMEGNGGNDTLMGGQSDDLMSGGAGNDSLNGQNGEDTIRGNDGNDTIKGGYGDDWIEGGAGHDVINGQVGRDTIWGGAGNDTIRSSYFNDTVYGGAGNDMIDGGSLDDRLWGGTGNDGIDGVTGNDGLWGEDGNDTLRGGEGIDSLYGGNGDDLIAGGRHSDLLMGEAGNDNLQGQDGLDTLIGGAGNDILIGGAHADTFVFGRGDGRDTIRDFENDRDTIALDPALWGGGLSRYQVIESFAHVVGGNTVLDFGLGDILIVTGLGAPFHLVDDLVFA